MACQYGATAIVELLLEHSNRLCLDFNAKDKLGKTAFMIACRNGYENIVKLLLDNSVSKNISLYDKDIYGKTAYYLAADLFLKC